MDFVLANLPKNSQFVAVTGAAALVCSPLRRSQLSWLELTDRTLGHSNRVESLAHYGPMASASDTGVNAERLSGNL